MAEWRSKETRNDVINTMYGANEIIFFDTETTGIKPNDNYIIEIGAYKFKICPNNTLEEIGQFHVYIKPPFEIDAKITDLTGITNEMLIDKPNYYEIFHDVKEFFGSGDVHGVAISAYNIKFDMSFLRKLYEENGEIINFEKELDVLKMARDKVKNGETENYKLETIAKHFGVDEGIRFHSALDDTLVAKRLFDIFSSEYIKEFCSESDDIEKLIPKIQSINFWENKRPGWNRIYVNTDLGSVYYCIRSKKWFPNPNNELDIDNVNMEVLQNNIWSAVGVNDEEGFAKFKGKKEIF